MLSRREVDAHEEEIRERVRALSGAGRRAYYELVGPRLKDPDTYAVLNYLFIAGLHHFYLGRWLRGIVNLAVFAGGAWLIASGEWQNGLALVAIITVVELYALFRAQLIVRAYNNRVADRVLAGLGTGEERR